MLDTIEKLIKQYRMGIIGYSECKARIIIVVTGMDESNA